MEIASGDKIPDIELRRMGRREPEVVRSLDVLGRGRVVVFGVPGAFTPTCSDTHLPGFVVRADEIKAKGVDRIACVATNDTFVMAAWAAARDVGDKIEMLSDGNADFTRALGLDADFSKAGLGVRSKRYAMVLEDGVVSYLGVEPAPGVTVSSAESVLAAL